MAEALGVAASVVGFASFALQLAESVAKLNRFCEHTKSAPERLQRLVEEIEIMGDLLCLLSDDCCGASDNSPLHRCYMMCKSAVDSLAAVADDFTSGVDRGRYRTGVKMVLKRHDTAELIERAERSLKMLDFAHRVYLATQSQRQLSTYFGQLQQMQTEQIMLAGMALDARGSCVDTVPKPLEHGEKSPMTTMALETKGSYVEPVSKPLESREILPATTTALEAKGSCVETVRPLEGGEKSHSTARSHRKRRPSMPDSDSWTTHARIVCRLLSCALIISSHRASRGWTFCLRVCTVIPSHHPALVCLLAGDVDGFGQHLVAGNISLWDEDQYGRNLAEVAARYGQIGILRLLYSKGADLHRPCPDSSNGGGVIVGTPKVKPSGVSGLARETTILDMFWGALRLNIGPCARDLGDIVDGFHFLRDEVYIDFNYIRDADRALLYLASGTPGSWTVQQCVVILHDVLATFTYPRPFFSIVEPALRDPSYFSAPIDGSYRPWLLHLLADAVGRYEWGWNQQSAGLLRSLVAAAVAAGCDLHCLSNLGPGMTPLMHMLFGAISSSDYGWLFEGFAQTLDAALQKWTKTLRGAGVDLLRYGEREARLFDERWEPIQQVFWPSCHRRVCVKQIAYGEREWNWHVRLDRPDDRHDDQHVRVLELCAVLEERGRAFPGSWPEVESLDPDSLVSRSRDPLLTYTDIHLDYITFAQSVAEAD